MLVNKNIRYAGGLVNDDRANGVKRAMENYYTKLAKEQAGPTRKNSKPEKNVEHECLLWFNKHGWSGQVYESKAKKINGRWMASGMKYGTVDWQGHTDQGFAAYVEFKAPGKLSSFNVEKNYRQREYITSKINSNAFACVVDSACLLEKIYDEWRLLRVVSVDAARLYLVSMLPKQKSP